MDRAPARGLLIAIAAAAAAAFVALLAVRCSSSAGKAPLPRHAAAPTASASSASIRLLDAIAGATIECAELSQLGGEIALLASDAPLFRTALTDARDGWLEGRQLLNADSEPVRAGERDPLERRDVLFLPPGSAGLHGIVAIPAPDPIVVVARVRTVLAGKTRPSLRALSIGDLPKDGELAARLRVALRHDPASSDDPGFTEAPSSTSESSVERGDSWHTLAVLLPADPSRESLCVSLLEGGGALFDELVIRRATAFERISLSRSPTRDAGDHSLVATVRCGPTQARSILLPAGARVRFDLRLVQKAPRLDFLLGRHPVGGKSPLALTVRLDGETELECTVGMTNEFVGLSLPLARRAGKPAALELTASGERGAIAVLGDPWVLSGEPPRAGPNVVLLSIDTLRRDALGCYGNPATRTPHIDSLAAAGTCFTNATSPVSFTLPAHVSIFSGQHPIVHGVNRSSRAIDSQRSALLAERLAERGWQTAAFTGGGFVHPDFGFDRGFGSYSIADPGGVTQMFQRSPPPVDERGAFAALAPTLDWLRRRADQPFFLFVHTYFVHNYAPSPEFARRRGAVPRPDLSSADDGDPDARIARMRAAEADPQSGGALRLLYEATVEEVDARLVGPLLVELDRLGIAERTIFALVSDHGEEFQEHGALFHGRHVWSELVDVPLLLRGPGVPAAARRGDAAHLEDVAPTIAARLGLEPDVRCFGRDLFAAADADPADPRARVLHLDHRDQLGNYRWDGLLFGRHAFLRQQLDDGAVRQHLFDLHEDPAELLDLASDRGDLCAGLARRLDAEMAAWLDFAARLPDPQRPFHGEREQLERRLEELGYAAR